MAPLSRFELLTFRLGGGRSIQLSYGGIYSFCLVRLTELSIIFILSQVPRLVNLTFQSHTTKESKVSIDIPTLTGKPAWQDAATRLQFAELIVNLTEKITGKLIVAVPETTFADCKELAARKAYAAGIASGIGSGRFDPKATTIREQIATMIYRAITYIEKETGKAFTVKNTTLEKFADKDRVSPWAAEGVGILANSSMMKGTSDTTLSSTHTYSVEQSVLLVSRINDKVQAVSQRTQKSLCRSHLNRTGTFLNQRHQDRHREHAGERGH